MALKNTETELPGACMLAGIFIGLCVLSLLISAVFYDLMRAIVKDAGTLLASMVVFGASLIAYEATISKTRHDRKVDQREQEAKRVNAMLRAEVYVANTLARQQDLLPWYWFSDPAKAMQAGSLASLFVPVKYVSFKQPDGIKEVWSELGIFPQEIISLFRVVRPKIERLEAACTEMIANRPEGRDIHNALCRVLSVEDVRNIIYQMNDMDADMKLLLISIGRQMNFSSIPEDERNEMLYGNPNDDIELS